MSTTILQSTTTGGIILLNNVNIDPRYLDYEDVRQIEKHLKTELTRVIYDDPDTEGRVLVVIDSNTDCNSTYRGKKKSINIECYFHLANQGGKEIDARTSQGTQKITDWARRGRGKTAALLSKQVWKERTLPTVMEILKGIEAKVLEVLLLHNQIILPYQGKQLK